MKLILGEPVRKRPICMTPNDDSMPEKRNNARRENACSADEAVWVWNTFHERSGSFADDYSTL